MAAEGEFPKTDGDILYDGDVNELFNMSPIGSVTAWLKSYTNVPTLPDNWVECNGQTLSDATSIYDGKVIPDLNSAVDTGLKGRFLRGHLFSGATESSANLTHTHTIPLAVEEAGSGRIEPGAVGSNTSNTGSDGGTESRPNNYSVVFIMRVR